MQSRAVVTRAFRPRPAGQTLAVVSAALRLLALIALDNGMYAVFAGAKKQITKKSLFLETPKATFFVWIHFFGLLYQLMCQSLLNTDPSQNRYKSLVVHTG